MDEPFNVTKTFGPMRCSQSSPAVGLNCTVVGWGYTSNVSLTLDQNHVFPPSSDLFKNICTKF